MNYYGEQVSADVVQQYKQNMTQWLSGMTPDQKKIIFEALLDSGFIIQSKPRPEPNGHEALPEMEGIKVVRADTSEYLLEKSPLYVDIFELIPFYQRVAFKKNVLVKGPKGTGKTLSLSAYAVANKIPMVNVECSEDTKHYELIGSSTLVGDNVYYVLGQLPTAIEIANETGYCILNFEEVNALPPGTQKKLNGILDWRQAITIPQVGRVYRLEPGAQIWCTGSMNPSAYGGTYDLNEDLRSRFIELEIGYPEHGQEKNMLKQSIKTNIDDGTIDLILRFAKETRANSTTYALSPRDVVDMVQLADLVGIVDALQATICKFEDKDRDVVRKSIDRVFPGTFTSNLKKHWRSFT